MVRKPTNHINYDDDIIYELNVSEHVDYINPHDYGITDFESINPSDYFITSGDAVVKATHLEKDMWRVAGEARKRFGKSRNKRHLEFQRKIWIAAGKCRLLLNMLKKVRGEHIFLETEWKDHVLYCIPKDPRKKDVID